ncbi:MAG: hypothetical protein ACLQAH_16540 [Limisphaerales bacterium]
MVIITFLRPRARTGIGFDSGTVHRIVGLVVAIFAAQPEYAGSGTKNRRIYLEIQKSDDKNYFTQTKAA